MRRSSGCSGGGKSTLLSELEHRGYKVLAEPGRQIVKEQEAIGGKALPWNDLNAFLELALSRYLHTFVAERDSKHPVFFDRGVIDSVQLSDKQPKNFDQAAKKFRYNRKVFMLPPWKEIYKEDAERKHNFEDALREYEELQIKYMNYGYDVILIPKGSVSERTDFILKNL